jgi:hypothetical protein
MSTTFNKIRDFVTTKSQPEQFNTKTFVKANFVLVSVKVNTPQESHILTHRRGRVGCRTAELNSFDFIDFLHSLNKIIRSLIEDPQHPTDVVVRVGKTPFLLTKKEVEDLSSVTIEASHFVLSCEQRSYAGRGRRH